MSVVCKRACVYLCTYFYSSTALSSPSSLLLWGVGNGWGAGHGMGFWVHPKKDTLKKSAM